jgi:predicted phosphodiesterase
MTEASVQYASDLHLEFRSEAEVDELLTRFEPRAPTLVLAGDVGDPRRSSYSRFLRRVAARFERTILVAGNHEFYGGDGQQATLAGIRSTVAGIPNLTFLHNELLDDPALPFRVFGGTMWSHITDSERGRVQHVLNDFARIPGFGVDEFTNEHHVFVDLLSAELPRPFEEPARPLVVVTHYLPSYDLIHPDYRDSDVNSAFASEVTAAHDPRIAAWFYGHTHKAGVAQRNGRPFFFCNPLGYPGERSRAERNAWTSMVATVSLDT